MQPFVMNHRGATTSIADLSFLHDAPAGKEGFIRVKDGHFVKPDGKRIRFWGVHLTEWSQGSVELPPKEDIPMWVSTLARYGINIVRLHFLDLPSPRALIDDSRNDTQHFDPRQLDRLDFLTAELKKRGIYMDLNLNVGRSYKPGDGVQDAQKIGWAKGLVYFDPRLIELQKDYAKQILTHVNPYTGSRYVDEPAIALVEIVNENALWVGFRSPSPYYEKELTGLYNDWVDRHLTKEALARIRTEAGLAEGAPIPRLSGPAIGRASDERYRAELEFCLDTESKFYTAMRDYLRGIGVQAPIIGTADHSHSSAAYAMLTNLRKLDVLDGHDYWQHPGSPSINTAMVNDPANSTVVELSRTAVLGKPYTVSEVNHPFPNEYAGEGVPIMAAYAGLQDWDMVIWYTFEPKLSPDYPPHVGDPFDISHDPVRMTELATGALMFLRGDVSPAKKSINRTYTRDQILAANRLPGKERPFFTPGFPSLYALMHRVRIKSFDGPPTASYPPVTENPLVSDTGQLAWRVSKEKGGLVSIDTPRAQGLVGFVKANGVSTANLSADIDNDFAAITLVSMDAKPIRASSQMLLTTGSKVQNSGMTWNANRTQVINWGTAPSMIDTVRGKLTLKGLAKLKGATLFPLDGAGAKIGDGIPGQIDGADLSFPLGSVTTCWYVILVQR